MIYEKLDVPPVDVEALKEDWKFASTHPLEMYNKTYGGLFITSADGEEHQNQVGLYTRDKNGVSVVNPNALKQREFNAYLHVNPTPLLTPNLQQLIQKLKDLGLNPHRARWLRLSKKGTIGIHRDTVSEQAYAVRLHIPIITNPLCITKAFNQEQHIPADGGMYLLKVNFLHEVFNNSNEDRIHFLVNVEDRNHISSTCRWPLDDRYMNV